MTTNDIAINIDQIHAKSSEALKQKNLAKYMSIFAESLKYQQLNGKIIDKKRLTRDQKKAWARMVNIEKTYERLECSSSNNLFIEIGEQNLTIWIRVFWFFKKKWTYYRKGRYEWIIINGDWKINKVKILEEKIN